MVIYIDSEMTIVQGRRREDEIALSVKGKRQKANRDEPESSKVHVMTNKPMQSAYVFPDLQSPILAPLTSLAS